MVGKEFVKPDNSMVILKGMGLSLGTLENARVGHGNLVGEPRGAFQAPEGKFARDAGLPSESERNMMAGKQHGITPKEMSKQMSKEIEEGHNSLLESLVGLGTAHERKLKIAMEALERKMVMRADENLHSMAKRASAGQDSHGEKMRGITRRMGGLHNHLIHGGVGVAMRQNQELTGDARGDIPPRCR